MRKRELGLRLSVLVCHTCMSKLLRCSSSYITYPVLYVNKYLRYVPLCSKMAILARAGGNGTAGTAMAVPVFEGEKWRRLDSNLTCDVHPLRALHRSLGRLRGL